MHPTKCVPVRTDQRLLQHWDEETSKKIMQAAGCYEFYSFRADAARYRLFTNKHEDVANNLWEYSEEEYDRAMEPFKGLSELRIVSQLRTFAETGYYLDGSPIYIGIGKFSDPLDDGYIREIDHSEVFSFTQNDDLTTQILDRRDATRIFILRVYALDLTRNGLLDLAITTSHGVSGGGGIDLVSLLPNGKFQDFSRLGFNSQVQQMV